MLDYHKLQGIDVQNVPLLRSGDSLSQDGVSQKLDSVVDNVASDDLKEVRTSKISETFLEVYKDLINQQSKEKCTSVCKRVNRSYCKKSACTADQKALHKKFCKGYCKK